MKSQISASGHLDFSEIDNEQLEALVRDLLENMGFQVKGMGRGQDGGMDMVATQCVGPIGDLKINWLVQCKQYSGSGRSVSIRDLVPIVDLCRQHEAHHYLLVCTTLASSGIISRQREFEKSCTGPKLMIWDGLELEKRLLEPENLPLVSRYFPQSFARLPSSAREETEVSLVKQTDVLNL